MTKSRCTQIDIGYKSQDVLVIYLQNTYKIPPVSKNNCHLQGKRINRRIMNLSVMYTVIQFLSIRMGLKQLKALEQQLWRQTDGSKTAEGVGATAVALNGWVKNS